MIFQRAPQAPLLPATPFRFICHFVAQFRGWYLAMVVLETAHALCSISLPYALARIIKGVSAASGSPQQVVASLSQPLTLFVVLALGEVIFARAGGACQITTGPRQRQNVTRQMYTYLQYHSQRYLSENFAGALAHRVGETAMGVTQTLWSIIFDFYPIAIAFAMSVYLLSRAHATLGWFVGGWAVLFVAASYWLARRSQPYALKASSARSETAGKLIDSVSNLTSAKLFARLEYERAYLDDQLRIELRAVRRSTWYSERIRWFQFSAAALLKVGVLYFALELWASAQIGMADFVMAMSLSFLIINDARNLSRRFLEFFEFIGNVENGVYTIVLPHELVDVKDAAAPVIARGQIDITGLEFAYGKANKVFDKLALHIPAGQRVGLVGSSGSGKSSFVSLLLRLYEAQAGSICIDGVDTRTMTQDALHAQLSLIPQDPTLFHRTLRENIRYGRIDATDAQVVAAAERALAHEFITQMPEQYESMVGERGVKLSGGQRQRIAIARVILKDAPILILDEATSSLDSITERAIQEALDHVMRDKTVLVVAHRLSTIAHLDRILVFDQGRIVEDGSHSELLARRGAYWALWSNQSAGFFEPEPVSAKPPTSRRIAVQPAAVSG
ncbi:MAG: msbA6 [Myxococcaceae bacterium]|nr:msbA6 [Myxococcaceae bacterium]